METEEQETLRNFWVNEKGEIYASYFSYEQSDSPTYNSETLSKFDLEGQLRWTKNFERGDYFQFVCFYKKCSLQ